MERTFVPVLKFYQHNNEFSLNQERIEDPDGLVRYLRLRNLAFGFELKPIYEENDENSYETAFYGMFSGGQHGRWECSLTHLECDGGNTILGKASISFKEGEEGLAKWYNTLINKYWQDCFASRLRVRQALLGSQQGV